jgi:hypothetical protein
MRHGWMGRALAWLGLATCTALAAPASAQPTPIPISPAATWKQEEAKLEMPPGIDGFRREDLVDYGDQRLDVSGTYKDPASRTTATLYLFRPSIANVGLWHDRSLASIQPHGPLGTIDRATAVTAPIVLHGPGGGATGLRTVMPVSGGAFVSTGLAMFQLRDWLVAVRMSSQTLDQTQLAARLDSFVAALSYDPAGMSQASAAAMADCADALRFKSAKRANRPDLGATLLLSALSGAADNDDSDHKQAAPPPPSVTFCRDPASTLEAGVYRADGSTEGYVIAVGDNGTSIDVARQPSAALLGGGGANDYWVNLSTVYASSTYRGFRNLPPPDKVIDVVRSEAPLSTVTRDASGDTTVNLNSSVLK